MGETDVLVLVSCEHCKHRQKAWFSQIVKGLSHCVQCDARHNEQRVIVE